MAASISYTQQNHRDRVFSYLKDHPDSAVTEVAEALEEPRWLVDKAMVTLQNFREVEFSIGMGPRGRTVKLWRAVA